MISGSVSTGCDQEKFHYIWQKIVFECRIAFFSSHTLPSSPQASEPLHRQSESWTIHPEQLVLAAPTISEWNIDSESVLYEVNFYHLSFWNCTLTFKSVVAEAINSQRWLLSYLTLLMPSSLHSLLVVVVFLDGAATTSQVQIRNNTSRELSFDLSWPAHCLTITPQHGVIEPQ